MTTSINPPTPARRLSEWDDITLLEAIARAGSIRKFSAASGIAKSTVTDELARRGISPGKPSGAPLRPAADPLPARDARLPYPDAALVREAGGDPEMWEAVGITASEEDTDHGSKSSRRVSLRRRRATVGPAQGAGSAPPAPAYVPGQRTTWLVLSDQHTPHHDEDLHQIALRVIADMKPDGLLLLGDLMDLSAGVSRHQPLPGAPTVQDNIDAGYRLLADYRAAAPDARMVLLEGNHDARLWRWLAENASAVAGVRQAGNGADVFSVQHLLRLDELGVEFIGAPGMPGGGYPLGQWEVIPDRLVAIHGSRARKGAGNSALSTAKDRGHGIIQGHTHRMGIDAFTNWTTSGKARPYFAVEAGTMAATEDGMGYAPAEARDWQQGFCVLTVWEDGAHGIEPALYCRGSLTLRDRRYAVRDGRVVVS